MMTLRDLGRLIEQHGHDLDAPVAALTIAGRTFDTDVEPVLMGVVNLSRDSSYRESVAIGVDAAVRRAQVQAAQGAHVIDIGAESIRATAAAVDPADQVRSLVPVIEQLTELDVATSIEGYDARVVRAGLQAGAAVLNLTGSYDDDTMFALAAEHGAAVVLCHVLGRHARDLDSSEHDDDPVPAVLAALGPRLERARELGVQDLTIDPGLGFDFRQDDREARVRLQVATLLQSFRLRRLGVPICHALPHAIDVFEDQFRSAEGVFAVLAQLGGTGVYRTHEIPLVRSTLQLLRLAVDIQPFELPFS